MTGCRNYSMFLWNTLQLSKVNAHGKVLIALSKCAIQENFNFYVNKQTLYGFQPYIDYILTKNTFY